MAERPSLLLDGRLVGIAEGLHKEAVDGTYTGRHATKDSGLGESALGGRSHRTERKEEGDKRLLPDANKKRTTEHQITP